MKGRTVSLELGSVQTQRDKLAAENTRLGHRIQYLEEQVASLESGMKQVSRNIVRRLLSSSRGSAGRFVRVLGVGHNGRDVVVRGASHFEFWAGKWPMYRALGMC